MGFDINEKITTELHYKDIALIAVALGEYQEGHKKTADKEILQRAANIVNRLGSEMANTEDKLSIEKCCCFPVKGVCNKELECYGNDKCKLDEVEEYKKEK